MSRIIVPLVLILTTVGWATETDIGACDSQDSSEQKGRALLQISASSRTRGMQPAASGSTAPLDQAGYEAVAELCCAREMRDYIKRNVAAANLELCNEGGLSGFTLYYDCEDDGQTLETLKNALVVESLKQECPFLASPGSCPTNPNCPVYPGGTFPPCGTTPTISTTQPATTTLPLPETTALPPPEQPTTTAGPINCPSMDIFMAIDASKSVANDWGKQIDFARNLVAKIMGTSNPQRHRINAHWFNSKTHPITGGGGHNDIGVWEEDGNLVQAKMQALVYEDIKKGATDHPQVFLTAESAFQASQKTKKTVILITDGETHEGNNCKIAAVQDYKNKKGLCVAGGVCEDGCDPEKCICGQYYANEFKDKNYELIVVGVDNGNHNTFFEKKMKAMASPSRFYPAKLANVDFDELANSLSNDLCA